MVLCGGEVSFDGGACGRGCNCWQWSLSARWEEKNILGLVGQEGAQQV